MLNSTDDVLRSLDAADPELSDRQRHRADELLERIATTPAGPHATVGRIRKPRPQWIRNAAWVAAVAVAIGVASLAIPGVGGSGVSYATWTATPAPVSDSDLQTAARACRAAVSDAHGPTGNGIADLSTIPVVLAERRGDFVAMLLHRDAPQTSVACVAINPRGSADVDNVQASIGGSDGPAPSPPPFQIMPGGIAQFGGRFPAAFTDGSVGANVAGVTIHAGDQTVQATVRGGRYVAWWPGKAFTDPAQSGSGGPREILSYDVTLNDGTIRTDVIPYVPPPIRGSTP